MFKCFSTRNTARRFAIVAALVAGSKASGAVLLDTGLGTFTPTGTQFGRISRTGEASVWGLVKPFPGVLSGGVPLAYRAFSLNVGPFPFIQISLDDPTASLFVAAYLNSFNPVNTPPNYGLNVNYLGDPGSSQPFGNPSFFQINIAPNSQLVLPINEVNQGGGPGKPFELLVEGFYDSSFNEVPEAHSLILFGSAMLALLLRRAHARRRKHTPIPNTGRAIGALTLAGLTMAASGTAQDISASALQQMAALLQEKESRSGTMLKMSSSLVYAVRAAQGFPVTGSENFGDAALSLNLDSRRGVLVNLNGSVSADLLTAIQQAGGRVISASPAHGAIRARLPIAAIASLAARGDVTSIKTAALPKHNGAPLVNLVRSHRTKPRPELLRHLGLAFIGATTTQGLITHGANMVHATGITGTGVRVGVLSDSAEAIPLLVATGDLPPGALNVADIVEGPGTSEGSAMMEIVYDLAPGVQIFFASAFNGPASFADNIRLLRNTYNCDIIVDDVGYSDESPFQDGVIAQAVNDITQSGGLYFSSAGNSGNLTGGFGSSWEGDFLPGGAFLPGYTLHSFSGSTFNRMLAVTGAVDLFWSDPAGSSNNDYDLFVLNAAGTAVLAASLDNQDGAGDPFEEVFNPNGFPANSRIVVAAFGAAQPRALHVRNFFGEPLQLITAGHTSGHNASAGCVLSNPMCTGRAFTVAAVAWNSARGFTRPFVGGASNPTEPFSSDGPRRVFYRSDGTAITPGNLLFGTNGGVVLAKPDIAAADGGSTRTPGFSPFFGTSAASPHAAGVAALLKSANPAATGAQIFNALTSTTLDIRAPGLDRDSGYGIIMAPAAVNAVLR